MKPPQIYATLYAQATQQLTKDGYSLHDKPLEGLLHSEMRAVLKTQKKRVKIDAYWRKKGVDFEESGVAFFSLEGQSHVVFGWGVSGLKPEIFVTKDNYCGTLADFVDKRDKNLVPLKHTRPPPKGRPLDVLEK